MVLKVSVQSQLAAILHIFQIQTQLRCVTRQVKFVVTYIQDTIYYQ